MSDEVPSLVFSIDQGYANGILALDDQIALKQIIQTLEPLKKHFHVLLLLNPMIGNQEGLNHILDTLVREHIQFIFDVYSSDVLTIGSSSTQNRPYDVQHGIAISPDSLEDFKKRYGEYLAGIRIFEVFAVDYTTDAIRTIHPEWASVSWRKNVPQDAFYQHSIAKEFLELANKKRIFLQWGDFHWFEFCPWDKHQSEREQSLANLISKYPGIITVTYNNNEPKEHSVGRLATWQRAILKFTEGGNARFGLSDQAWIRNDPVSTNGKELASWVEDALHKGCRYIQFEPFWYFFKMPRGTYDLKANYTDDPKWSDRGSATENFKKIESTLLSWTQNEKVIQH